MATLLVPTASSADVVTSPPSDPLGDVVGAPDVTQVVVHPPMPFVLSVTVANEPVPQFGSVIELRFDTDMDLSTGSPSGVDLLIRRQGYGGIELCNWHAPPGEFFCSWNTALVSSMKVHGVMTATIRISLNTGLGAGFDFSIAAYNAFSAPIDLAPDTGSCRYIVFEYTPAQCPPAAARCLTKAPQRRPPR